MRRLSKKQKGFLDKWYEENKDKIQVGICFFDLAKCDLFSYDFLEQLREINDFEILESEINHYIQEKAGF